jgi:hypothetical protein
MRKISPRNGLCLLRVESSEDRERVRLLCLEIPSVAGESPRHCQANRPSDARAQLSEAGFPAMQLDVTILVGATFL